jgi:hypothetical protein
MRDVDQVSSHVQVILSKMAEPDRLTDTEVRAAKTDPASEEPGARDARVRRRVARYGVLLDHRIQRRRRRRRWLVLVALAVLACVVVLAVDAAGPASSRTVTPSAAVVAARSGAAELVRFRLALERCFAIVEAGTPRARVCGVSDRGDQLMVFRSPSRNRHSFVAGLAPRGARRVVITVRDRARSVPLRSGRAFVARAPARDVRIAAVGRRGRILAEATLPSP